jgi:hypothetical protein
MLPAALQFLIAMVAHAVNARMARGVDYLLEEVRVLREALATATSKTRIHCGQGVLRQTCPGQTIRRRMFAAWIATVAACGPTPPPAEPPVPRSVPTASATVAPSDARTQDASVVEGVSPQAEERSTSPEPPASRTAPNVDFPVYCFSWVHGSKFSTDCYRTRAQCRAERIEWAISNHDTLECEKRDHAACTTVIRDGAERCFGDSDNCTRYRIAMIRQHLETGNCVYR